MPEEYTVETVSIFQNVMWSSNAPSIYLTLNYDIRKDSNNNVLNKQVDDKGNWFYTFYNLTLTANMPGKNAYYGYTIGAYVTSYQGQQTNQIMLKDGQPQYWKEVVGKFGDFKVSLGTGGGYITAIPIYVTMVTTAPGYYVIKGDTKYKTNIEVRGGKTFYYKTEFVYERTLTQKALNMMKGWGYTNPEPKDELAWMSALISTTYQGAVAITPTAARNWYYSSSYCTSKYVNQVYGEKSFQISKQEYDQLSENKWKYTERPEYVSSEVVDEEKSTKDKTVYITKRDGMVFGYTGKSQSDLWFIGEGYKIPEIKEIVVSRVGGQGIQFVCSYEPQEANSVDPNNRWDIVVKLKEGTDETTVWTIPEDQNTNESTYSTTVTGLDPTKTYTIYSKFGSVDQETNEARWTKTAWKTIPPRGGFYVYHNNQWNYCQSYIGITNNQGFGEFQQYKYQMVGTNDQKIVQDDESLKSGIEDQVTNNE